VYLNVRDRRALPGRTAEGGCRHTSMTYTSTTNTSTLHISMNPKARTQA